jgi:hypothetical protein
LQNSDDPIGQLERLADLNERGMLSDLEFELAKRRLFDDRPTSNNAAPPIDRGLGAREWLATGAATCAILLLAGYAFGLGGPDATVENGTASEPVPELAVAEEPSAPETGNLCGSAENYAQIKDMVFEKAAEVMGGDPVPLNTLKRAVSFRMELPVVSAIDEQVERTDCTGRLVIDLPPGTREAFDGQKSLEADLEYSFQPAADGDGYVIRAEGIGYMVQRLIAAASVLNARRLASQGGPQLQATYNPSFDCGQSLTNVERMICQDEQLATADRVVSAKFAELRQNLPPAFFGQVRESQRAFLKQRAVCADTACVRAAYVEQWNTLTGIERSAAASEPEGLSPDLTMDENVAEPL